VSLPRPPLFLITDRRQAARPLAEIVEAALIAGCRWVSLREKDLAGSELQALVDRIRPLTDRHNARLGIHGDAQHAAALGLDAVHLASGSDAAAARRIMGKTGLIGMSVHGAKEASELDPDDIDYAVIGPAFATVSKPGYGPALGSPGIATAVRASRVPLIAVGGIMPENIRDILQHGAAGIAVMGGVMRAGDPSAVTRDLLVAVD
jgi:thiamine-phosphate pyrophosphorylase